MGVLTLHLNRINVVIREAKAKAFNWCRKGLTSSGTMPKSVFKGHEVYGTIKICEKVSKILVHYEWSLEHVQNVCIYDPVSVFNLLQPQLTSGYILASFSLDR